MRSVASGADGTYSMKSVAPGMYQLLVVDESESHTITSEPVADDFDDLGETVEVRAKETVKRDLRGAGGGGEVGGERLRPARHRRQSGCRFGPPGEGGTATPAVDAACPRVTPTILPSASKSQSAKLASGGHTYHFMLRAALAFRKIGVVDRKRVIVHLPRSSPTARASPSATANVNAASESSSLVTHVPTRGWSA